VIERSRSPLLIVATLVVMALCNPASAAAELVGFAGPTNWTGKGYGATISASLEGANSYTGFAGELNWLWGADSNPATIAATPDGFVQAFFSYCVDFTHSLGDPQDVVVVSSTGFYQDIIGPDVLEGGAKASWLFNRYAGDIRSSVGTDLNLRAAALQVAIWEALYDSSANLVGDRFTLATTGAVATYAGSYLTELYSHQGEWTSSAALVLKTENGQDQITRVPEPATVGLLGLGLFALAASARRRTLGLSASTTR